LFARQLHDSMKGFIEHPIALEYIKAEKIYLHLAEALRNKIYQKKKLIKKNIPRSKG